ncbi:glycosyl hydrolase [Duganella radicis]|uniref:Glycosyl hydrolase n=2 Tax=Duganella radicis TaxID=551988 RepID=A0A6L6PQY4_9BURK|nr:glycosyl hydrolase [Duganella radicis]
MILSATGGAAAVAAVVPPVAPAVLQNKAVPSKKAPQSAMLAVTRAGPRLVASGERGIILLSDDAGVNWRQANVPVQTSLTALRFTDQQRGWAVGHLGTIVHTADGGVSWSLQLDGMRAARLAADGLSASGHPPDQKLAEQFIAEGPDKPFFDVDFSDGLHGYVVGAYNLAFSTGDGGKTWQTLTPRLPNANSLHLYAVRARGDKVFIVGEQGLVLRSRDGGASFEALPSPYKGSFFGLLLTRSGTLLAYGLRGSLYRSSNDGADWQAIATNVGNAIGAAVERDDGSLMLLTHNGGILVSADDGRSFAPHKTGAAAPVAGVAAAPDGALVLATLRGLRRQPTP